MITYKRPTTIGEKPTNFKHVTLSKTEKHTETYTSWLPQKAQLIHGPNSFTNNGKKLTLPLKQNLIYMCKLWYLCGNLCDIPSVVRWPNIKTNFPRNG